jgi:hypothetical protein
MSFQPWLGEVKMDKRLLASKGDVAVEPNTEETLDTIEFKEGFGESLDDTLNLDTWKPGDDLSGVFERLDREIGEAIAKESDLKKEVRKTVFPLLGKLPSAPKGSGVFLATMSDLKEAQANVLFNGAIEACDGNCLVHDTVPLTIAQIGIVLVSYNGNQGTWAQRLFRRDLRIKGLDPLEETLSILEKRAARSGVGQQGKKDTISNLMRRGIMSYGERAVLLEKSNAAWRMGHGHPAPYELLTGSGSMDLLHKSLSILSKLVLEQKKFVFIPSAPSVRHLYTIGNALRPLEFAIIENDIGRMDPIIEKGNLRGEHREKAQKFLKDAGPKIVTGIYRTSLEVPAQIFYAHEDHAHEAAIIAMADSIIQSHRGFPVLIDLADSICGGLFGADGFKSTVTAAYVNKGSGLSYFNERDTRD